MSAAVPLRPPRLSVERLHDRFGPAPWPAHVVDDLDAIFWETAGRPPSLPADRVRFRERWLGSYLRDDAEHTFIAVEDTPHGARIRGYLVGTLATSLAVPRFGADRLFQIFAPLLTAYPAHLHINLAEATRGFGVGRDLIERFCRHAAAHGAHGVHVITGAEARNVAFYYGRAGFTECGRTALNGRDIVLLGRPLVDTAVSPETHAST